MEVTAKWKSLFSFKALGVRFSKSYHMLLLKLSQNPGKI